MSGRTFKPVFPNYTSMAAAGIYEQESPYLERYVQVGIASGRVIKISFPEFPSEDAMTDHAILDRLARYFEGARVSFDDVEVALTVPTDHRAVLEALRKVPYGQQITVARLAVMTPDLDPDDDADVDTVREALAGNPIPIVIPDHRVRDGPSGAPPGVEQRLRSLEGL